MPLQAEPMGVNAILYIYYQLRIFFLLLLLNGKVYQSKMVTLLQTFQGVG